jgi:hypothetical protein
VYGTAFKLVAHQETSGAIRYWGTATWQRYFQDGAYGGYIRAAAVGGSGARISFSGRAVAFVSNTGPARGRVAVYLDGRYQTTLDLYAAATQLRRIVWSKSFASSGTHVLEIRPTGTKNALSMSPRIDLDAFVVG